MKISPTLSPLNALSPLDGRYATRGQGLRPLLSEAGFMYHRVRVEVAWLLALSDAGLPELKPFSVVLSTVRDGERTSTIGLIGPTRMRYQKAISVVDGVSHTVARLFESQSQ